MNIVSRFVGRHIFRRLADFCEGLTVDNLVHVWVAVINLYTLCAESIFVVLGGDAPRLLRIYSGVRARPILTKAAHIDEKPSE